MSEDNCQSAHVAKGKPSMFTSMQYVINKNKYYIVHAIRCSFILPKMLSISTLFDNGYTCRRLLHNYLFYLKLQETWNSSSLKQW